MTIFLISIVWFFIDVFPLAPVDLYIPPPPQPVKEEQRFFNTDDLFASDDEEDAFPLASRKRPREVHYDFYDDPYLLFSSFIFTVVSLSSFVRRI